MDSVQSIFFLISLSTVSLIVLILLRILDFCNVATKQKIIFIKLSLIMVFLSPLFFYLLNLSLLKGLVITIPTHINSEINSQAFQIIHYEHKISWLFYITSAYEIGLFIMLFRIVFSYFSVKKQLTESKKIHIQGTPVFLSKNIKTPISFGLPKAKIYFPLDAELKWTSREIQMSLAHEIIHVEQNDSFWKFLSLIVQALLFYTPWIYYLHKRLELEMEILCDKKTCHKTKADIQEYGNLLLAMTCIRQKNFIFNNLTDSTLKRRFLAMKEKNRNARFLVVIMTVFLFLISSATISLASGIIGKSSVFKITSKIIINGKVVSSPIILAKENQKALIVLTNTNNTGSQGLRIELTAMNKTTLGLSDAIIINYDIQYKEGREKLHSRPQVVVLPHHESKISLSSDSAHSYEMDIIAERVNS